MYPTPSKCELDPFTTVYTPPKPFILSSLSHILNYHAFQKTVAYGKQIHEHSIAFGVVKVINQQKQSEGKKAIVVFVSTEHIANPLALERAIVPAEKQQAS